MSSLKTGLALSLITASLSSFAADLESTLDYTEIKAAPDVTLDVVQDIFGFNLDNAQGMDRIFLLAVGMDHTTPNSPHADQAIGIPYIVDRGAAYWVSRLTNKDYEVEVLVNNALLLMFTQEQIPGGDRAALGLLTKASKMGYWPADYYIADYNITNHLSRDVSHLDAPTGIIEDPSLKRLASKTMANFSSCAELGFAPCQYRLGFWLTSSQATMKEGMDILQHAIKTTISDKRYQGILNGSVIEAAREVVMKGDMVGIDKIVRQEYLTLMQDQIKLLERSGASTANAELATHEINNSIREYLQNNP